MAMLIIRPYKWQGCPSAGLFVYRRQKDVRYVVLISKSIEKIMWSYLLNRESSFFRFKN